MLKVMDIIKSIPRNLEKQGFKAIETLWLLYVHILGVLGLFWFTFQEKDIQIRQATAFILIHFASGLGITGGAHRLWAHKSYTATLPVKIFLMIMNCCAFQGSIWHWSRDHRLHHKFSDTPLDPHDSKKGIFFSHVGWLLVKKNDELIKEGMKIDMNDLKNDPVVMFQKRYYYPLAFTSAFLIPGLIGYNLLGGSFLFSVLFLGFAKYCFTLNATWCVNSICHFFGSRPFNKNIEARDNFFVSLIAVGEGWHNWHHEYPRDWRGSKNDWWMFNPTTTFIQILKYLGLANTSLKN